MKRNHISKNISIIGISLILALAGDQTLYVVLPVLAASGIYPLARVGILLSANRFIRLLSNPVVGSWLHRKQRKPFLLAGLLIGAVTPILYIMGIRSFWLFLLGRACWGVAFSLLYITSVTMVMDMTDHHNHGWGSGLLQVFYFLGLAITPLLGGILNDWIGFKAALLVSAGLGIVAFILTWIFVEESSQYNLLESSHQPTEKIGAVWNMQHLRERIKVSFQVLKGESVALFYVYMLSAFISEGVIMATISLYIVNQYGSNFSLAGVTIQAASVGGAALAYRSAISAGFSPWFGKLSDRFTNGWLGIWIANLFGVLGLAGLAFVQHPAVLPVGLFLIAINSGIIFTGTPALIARMDRTHQAILIGWMATAVDVGLTLAPLISYSILGVVPIRTLYMLAVILAVTSIPISSQYLFFRKSRQD